MGRSPLSPIFTLVGGMAVDGTGADPVRRDLAVDDGRMTVLPPGTAPAGERIDVDGLVIAPGFIDVHSHADLEPMTPEGDDPLHASRVRQGVTTEVTGNCGFSPFPVPSAAAPFVQRFLSVLFGPAADTFENLAAYRAAVESKGLASNVAPLIGHGTLRAATIGMTDRPPTPHELTEMQQALLATLEHGAFGLSSGLCYPPATFAAPDELTALAAVATRTGAIYATHIRNETDLVGEALVEAIDTAKAAGARLHISHLKAAGRPNWGSAPALLEVLNTARESGVDVTADAYPYTAGSTMLHSLLPPWLTNEGIDTMLARLGDPGVRRRVDAELAHGIPGWQNLGSAAGWERVTVASSPRHRAREGSSITELGSHDETTADTIARLLLDEEGAVLAVIHAMDEEDVRAFLAWPHTMIGSDGIPMPGMPHPRLTGTFPRMLGRYRTESLASTVRKMTGDPARRFGIPDRGLVASGLVADLVVFDPQAIMDNGTYSDPWRAPSGIVHVFVNGRPAVRDGAPLDTTAGQVLTRRREVERARSHDR